MQEVKNLGTATRRETPDLTILFPSLALSVVSRLHRFSFEQAITTFMHGPPLVSNLYL